MGVGAGESRGGAAGVDGSGVFGDAVPAIVDVVGAGAAYGFGNAAAESIIDVFHGGGAGDDFDEAVFSIVGKRGIGGEGDGERIGGGVAVIVMHGADAGAEVHCSVLIQSIDGVVVRAGQGEAVGGFFTVADAVVLVGAIQGIGGFIGGDELMIFPQHGKITPCGAALWAVCPPYRPSGVFAAVVIGVACTGGTGSGTATAGDACALSYRIHCVVTARNDRICRAIYGGDGGQNSAVALVGAGGLVNGGAGIGAEVVVGEGLGGFVEVAIAFVAVEEIMGGGVTRPDGIA